ncbi:Fic family protein [Pseudogemmatithrix spongiicola]|uniref:Fic family protein n=1 Tax=Pseudogemmatithrix spongiicola TaxID=3062599 RepID=A0AA49Q5A7_9BACT|nr:Fic family protein [Gemmatimonadaceae bacterium 'strain 138']WKW15624.1 Fic family protein [Gemmatimonadaceae bacterium 'strain 318']
MSYIHNNPEWPRLAWDIESLAGQLSGVRHRQGLLVGRVAALGLETRQESQLAALTADVVKSSAIEGEQLPPAEVRSSIARRLGIPVGGLSETSRTVDGVVQMMLDATQHYDQPLTERRLFDWHLALFPVGHTARSRLSVGAWRTDAQGPMQVVSGSLAEPRVHFEAPAAARVQGEMERFFEWMNAPSALDPVLRAAVAHFWFVTIHPFDDGNGRIARAIADLALARADGRRERYYSMSAQIEAERNDYYRQLERAQSGGLDITSWIRWFLGCLDRSFTRAEGAMARVLRDARVWDLVNARGPNDRQRLVLSRMLGDWAGWLTTSKYATLAKCSSDTALRDVKELVGWGVLVRNEAGGRSVSYRLVGE